MALNTESWAATRAAILSNGIVLSTLTPPQQIPTVGDSTKAVVHVQSPTLRPFWFAKKQPKVRQKRPCKKPKLSKWNLCSNASPAKAATWQPGCFSIDQWGYNGFVFVFLGGKFSIQSKIHQAETPQFSVQVLVCNSFSITVSKPWQRTQALQKMEFGVEKSGRPSKIGCSCSDLNKKTAFNLQRARSADKAVPDHNRCNSDKKPLARSKSGRKQQERCHTNFVFIISF